MTPSRTQLASGLTVVSEARPGAESVAVGLYFPTGSRHETRANNGISHFLEHLVFKGTPTRSAEEVNRELDRLGGLSNAYTSKEVICFHASVLPEHLDRALALHGDLIAHGLPDGIDAEVDRERAVILQEISAVEDSPEDLVGDLADVSYFGDQPLALPVVGSARAVERLALDDVRSHVRSHLVCESAVVAAAGRVDHEDLVAAVERHLAELPAGARPPGFTSVEPRVGTRLVERDLEQVHLCLSAPGVARDDPHRSAADLLSCVVGEGYSSRLFREVRERRGLAYTVGSSLASYSDTGSWNLWAGVTPERLAETLDVIGSVLVDVREHGVLDDELESARDHLRRNLILGHEAPGSRMAHLAERALAEASDLSLDTWLESLQQVDLAEVRALARELLSRPLGVAAVGAIPAGALPDDGWDLGA